MDLRKVMIVTGFIGIVGIPTILWFYFDYTDFSWATNSGNYISLFVCVSIIISSVNNYISYGKPEKPEK